jgi:CxxC-x17-CxxC domain-containing protein
MYIIGKTGMGKTGLLKNMAIQDIQKGNGVGFVDPHGEVAEGLLDYVPPGRINDVIYFNPADLEYPIAFNVMEKVSIEYRHLVASGLMGVFKKIWPDVWSARMEYILNNSILALLEYPGSTLLGVNRMLADPEYRKKIVENVTDPMVKSFWVNEFARYTQRLETEATAAIQNKVGQFISSPLIRNIIGQVQSSIDMRKIMDEKKILILDLSKGRIGEDNSRLLGALLITKLQLAAMSRINIPEKDRSDFFLYVDEFQNFATEAFGNILSEARKYRLDLILAHQYIAQMDEKLIPAVFGNVGTLISFRVGAEDAEFLEKEFSPEFMATDLVNLPKYNIYLKLLIDGVAGNAFSAQTLAPYPEPAESNREKIIKVSRERYAVPRSVIEDKISKWTGLMNEQEPVRQQPNQTALYDAKCSSCEKWTKVTFQPDNSRPVYCKTCLKKIKGERENVSQGNIQPQPQPRIQIQVQSQPQSQPQPQPQFQTKHQVQPCPQPQPQIKPCPQVQSVPQSPNPSISIDEAIKKEPVSFSPKKENTTKEEGFKRKEVNIEELKKTLEESLKGINRGEKDENSKGL